MIKFYLPNFCDPGYDEVNYRLVNLLKEYPHYFYDNVTVGAIYGTFPGVIWNGGRVMQGPDIGLHYIINLIYNYHQLGIPLRFTYTNLLISEPEQLNDTYANTVTALAHNKNNEILVANDYLEQYLRTVYPNYKYISSTTKCLLNEQDIIDDSDKYYMSVLDYRKNRDMEFLKSLPNPEKFEILINAWCRSDCPYRREHYEDLSRAQLFNTPTYVCEYIKDENFFSSLDKTHVLTVDEIYNQYVPLGFVNFKIEGRTYHIVDVIETYVYYLVKPEYKDRVRAELLKSILT